MLNILKDAPLREHYVNGFLETGVRLSGTLVQRIRNHYAQVESGRNDFPKFFDRNEHQAYLEGRLLGTLINAFPQMGKRLVRRFYARAYSKAVYCEQHFIEEVLREVLAGGFGALFQTRFLVASYDMYLRNTHQAPAAGIHTDLPNFHHFYETENDISLYIPLVDFDAENGGRLSVLPEAKLKVPGNVLLKMLHEHFSRDGRWLDESGYIDPGRISTQELAAFIRSPAHQDLMQTYKGVIALAKRQFAGDFRQSVETAGRVLMFNNKNFHAAEQWKRPEFDREVYVIRMVPLYDIPILLREQLHGEQVNHFLVDLEQGSVARFAQAVDVRSIPSINKLPL